MSTTLQTVTTADLKVAPPLYHFVETELLPGTGIDPDQFWSSLAGIVRTLQPRNAELLKIRDELQGRLDAWLRERRDNDNDPAVQEAFLREIGYIIPSGDDFDISTENVDAEIASVAGPQLVVPVNNARYALNAANARWGSLYDALYGTDAIQPVDSDAGAAYDPQRGQHVFDYVDGFLDDTFPLSVSWKQVIEIGLNESDGLSSLDLQTASGSATLQDSQQFVGFNREGQKLTSVLLRHNGLHVELCIDRDHPIGREHRAGIRDVVMEAAVTTIQDCEDSVAAVDADDKVIVYRNWLGLMKGDLSAGFEKNGRTVKRALAADRTFTQPNGQMLTLPGRSLLLVRNVGMHMMTDAVTTAGGEPVPEGFLDAMITAAAAMHDLSGDAEIRNSRSGSIYIVKPKQHGPDDVALTTELFERVEEALDLDAETIKIGIMDEERRTTLNLSECIRQAKNRVVFINTGFLDRTGDEIHSLMEAGPFVPKPEIKDAKWLAAYEDANVDVGLQCGFRGRAQIGKGMWAMPDRMSAMLSAKSNHPSAGANTAWVPSPTAAVLHALHYHQLDVHARQRELLHTRGQDAGRAASTMADLLTPSILGDRHLTEDEITRELENNAQGILGYVVRWIDQGIGCSKVPDIDNVGLMEDRATLRISSQHVANWLHHGMVTRDQVIAVFTRMAKVVDQQNHADPNYQPMAPDTQSSLAFQAALELVFAGREEPCGYTERTLTKFRRLKKQNETRA